MRKADTQTIFRTKCDENPDDIVEKDERQERNEDQPLPLVTGKKELGLRVTKGLVVILQELDFCPAVCHFLNVLHVAQPRQNCTKQLLKSRSLRHAPEALTHRVCVFSNVMGNFNAP